MQGMGGRDPLVIFGTDPAVGMGWGERNSRPDWSPYAARSNTRRSCTIGIAPVSVFDPDHIVEFRSTCF